MKELLISLILAYLFVGFISLGFGIDDAPKAKAFSDCKTKWSRATYLFPAYRFGCWLGTPLEETE